MCEVQNSMSFPQRHREKKTDEINLFSVFYRTSPRSSIFLLRRLGNRMIFYTNLFSF